MSPALVTAVDACIEMAYVQHAETIRRYIGRHLNDWDLAEDLTQQVFMDALVRLREMEEEPREMLAWLYRIAQRRTVDAIRDLVAERRAVAETPRPVPNVLDVESGDSLRAVVAAVAALRPAQRQVFLRRVFDDQPYAEIAAALASDEAACRMQYTRALRVVRGQLVAQAPS